MKTVIKSSILILAILAGLIAVSCTDGYSLGKGGSGNLNVVGIPSTFNNKFMTADVTIGTNNLSFNPACIKISRNAARAPLFYSADSTQYTASDKNVTVTINIYDKNTNGKLLKGPIDITGVDFFTGAAIANWTE
ncbi:MAG: hypothetical protein FWF29_11425 [Treponema sp.]|nr:hypothetical protein [Treponema sp.]